MQQRNIRKILIANRGEIACRIIRTAQQLGIECVALYSDADINAQHVQLANEAYHVGKSPAKESYLLGDIIIQIANRVKADAIHPGYGFLSENADFSQACSDNDIVFIGPSKESIQSMGSKSEAKKIMSKAGVPLVEGYHGDDQSEQTLQREADKIGYPLLIKATAGGGGKGMRIVKSSADFLDALQSCKRESISSFGDDKVLVEKYLTKPRHVEIQIFADQHGNAVHLFERDCSVQRRHQKVIEEAPAPGLSEQTRNEMGDVAITAANAIGYYGAGTVEFLYDEDGSFYFMEMNTRLQVEHPVTEKITGLDLVEWQIIVANGLSLPLAQNQLKINGHAFEARIYAEDPDNDFLPTTGQISHLSLPKEDSHVRVDSGIVSGDEVSIYYDPMIAKLIVWDKDRRSALARMSGALKDFHVAGLKTNINFLNRLANNQAFIDADLDTHFLDKQDDALSSSSQKITNEILIAAALVVMQEQSLSNGCAKTTQINSVDAFSPWNETSGWRLNEDNYHEIEFQHAQQVINIIAHFCQGGYLFELDGNEYEVSGKVTQNRIQMTLNGHKSLIHFSKYQNELVLFDNAVNWELEIKDNSLSNIEQDVSANLVAPMPGTVIGIMVSANQTVKAEQALMVIEAMKMEHTIRAHRDMIVSEVFYQVGDLVDEGAELVAFEEE